MNACDKISRLLKNNKPISKWCKNSDCKMLAIMFTHAGLAKENELSIEVQNAIPDNKTNRR